jgi:hypothetical protein
MMNQASPVIGDLPSPLGQSFFPSHTCFFPMQVIADLDDVDDESLLLTLPHLN